MQIFYLHIRKCVHESYAWLQERHWCVYDTTVFLRINYDIVCFLNLYILMSIVALHYQTPMTNTEGCNTVIMFIWH